MGNRKKILIIEDDTLILNMLSGQLTEAGYEIEIAEDGEEGLDKVRGIDPDLVILDLTLPKMDGMAVLRKLRSNPSTNGIKVIILSNNNQDSAISDALNLGVVDYLVKVNFTPEEIVDKVNGVLS